MDGEWRGPIGTLRDAARARRMLWAFCLWCGHAGHLDPWKTALAAKRDMSFDELARRLTCNRCKARGKSLVVASLHQMPQRD